MAAAANQARVQTLNEASLPFLVWVQSMRSEPLDHLMRALSWIGREEFYLLLVPIVYWCHSARGGLLAGYGLLLGSYAGELVKWSFKLPRPLASQLTILWPETSPGFVSTHASASAGFWGGLALALRSRVVVVTAVVMVLGIGFSRLYLGSHWPADVVGGWVLGLLAALAAPAAVSALERLHSRPAPERFLWPVVLSAAAFLLFPGQGPGEWPAAPAATHAGVFLGFTLGHLSLAPSEAPVRPWLRYSAGIAVVLAVYLGMKVSSPGQDYFLEQLLRFFRYAVLGFCISGLMPRMFRRLGI
ncbi:MAG: phosphatase PAP2 family protein [Armatimonadetes bacterium]|nr:phosphatase PAP2 family protein [Armatimonadota bacterium]